MPLPLQRKNLGSHKLCEETVPPNEFENIMWGLFIADNSSAQVITENTIVFNAEDEMGNPIGHVWAGISLRNYGDRVNRAPVLIKDNYIYTKAPYFYYGILSGSKAAIIRDDVLELDQPQESLWIPFSDSAGICITNSARFATVQRHNPGWPDE